MNENDVRTMLRRRAGDIVVDPPPWSELGTERLVAEERRPSPPRWLAAAALLVTVAVTGSLLLLSRRSEPPVSLQQVAPPELPFEPASAAPIWPGPADVPLGDTRLADARQVAAAYLESRMPRPVRWGDGRVDEAAGTASLPWTRSDAVAAGEPNGPSYSGTVFLRRIDVRLAETVVPRWHVVGSMDDELRVDRL
ncbi:MAG TPA: hypothetical protein VHE80_05490, partial [Acidimicrobiales bacterium]|nr:hypothetical protein [Acidimicrobiales bacterium]